MPNISIIAAPTFTRPSDTTQYAAGDLVANSTTAGSVVPLVFAIPRGLGKNLKFIGVKMTKSDGADITGAVFRTWLFSASPTVTNGDNGAIAGDWAAAGYIGRLQGGTMLLGDDAVDATYVDVNAQVYHYLGTETLIYGLIEATGTYTPASAETFTPSIVLEQS